MYKVADVVSFGNSTGGLQLGQEVLFEQLFNWKELFGWEAKNKYMATSKPDGKQFFVSETGAPDCHRQCCGANREWNLSVYNGPDRESPEVLRMTKPQECCIDCCGRPATPCCADRVLTVTTPDGKPLSTASQQCCICCSYNIDVKIQEEKKYTITGTHCQLGMCCPCLDDADFEIIDVDGDDTGGSVSRPAMTCAEVCGKTNRIHVQFPEGASQSDKTGIMGGAILFDILEEIREENSKKNNDGGGGGGGN